MELENKILQAGATLYPDKIIIETLDRVMEGFAISSAKVTVLPIGADVGLLGMTVREHMALTTADLHLPRNHKQHYAEFLKQAGFVSGKEHHKNALRLELYQSGKTITLSPTRNGGYTGKGKGFLEIEGSKITITAEAGHAELGERLRSGWAKCECSST
ncbi:MAG: hypothetical protein EOO61_13860 [Hymenobacter sp.]|nr:MAG: hypothetical protein EOO61_13860 [Hymenobacter sp.]